MPSVGPVVTVGRGRPWECLRRGGTRCESITKSDDEGLCYSKQNSNESIASSASSQNRCSLSKNLNVLDSRVNSLTAINGTTTKFNITVGVGSPRTILSQASFNRANVEYHAQLSSQSVSSLRNTGEAYDMLNLMPSYDFSKHLDSSKFSVTPQASRSNSKTDVTKIDSNKDIQPVVVAGDTVESNFEKMPSVDQPIKTQGSILSRIKATVQAASTPDASSTTPLQKDVSKSREGGCKKSILDRIRTRIKLIAHVKENAELNATFKNGSFEYGVEPLRSCGTDNTNDWEHSGSNNEISTAKIQRGQRSSVLVVKSQYDGETISANYNRKLAYIQKHYGDIEAALKEVQENSPRARRDVHYGSPAVRVVGIPQLWLQPRTCKSDLAHQYPRLFSLYCQSKNGITNTS